MHDQSKLGYTIDEAAHAIGSSRSTLYTLMKTGKLRFRQIGSKRIIPRSALLELLGETEDQVAAA